MKNDGIEFIGPDNGEMRDLPIFSLNEDDSLLMIPGLGMRVDTKKHRLGMRELEHLPE